MINELIKETNICLENGCWVAALSLCLKLPDICGKALYQDEKPRTRYIKWIDEYCKPRIENNPEKYIFLIPHFDGKTIY